MDVDFFAFISYSHRDEAFAKKAHKLLEKTRIPPELVAGLPGSLSGKKRVHPVFRDTEELPSSSSLPSELKKYLERSAYLVVICSPDAASSQWVNEEVRYFIELGRRDKILCLVVRYGKYGENNINDVLPQVLLEPGEAAPLAADVTKKNAPFSREVLRVAAGILGVGFDVLYRREKRRQRRNIALAVAASLVLFLPVIYLTNVYKEDAASKAREALVASSLAIAEKSERAAEDLDINKSLAIALEGMPDERRGVQRPLVPRLQAALSRSFWRLPGLQLLGDGDTPIAARITPKGLVSIAFLEDGGLAIQKDGTFVSDKLEGNFFYGDVASSGEFIVAAGLDGVVRIYDVDGGLRQTFRAHQGAIRQVRVSPDSRFFVTLGQDSFVKVWTVEGDPVLSQFFENSPLSAEFSKSGKQLILATFGSVSVWDVTRGVKTYERSYPQTAVTAANFTPDEGNIAVVVDDTIRFINIQNNFERTPLKYPTEPAAAELTQPQYVESLEFSPDGELILARRGDGLTMVWSVNTSRLVADYYLLGTTLFPPRFVGEGDKVLLPGPFGLWEFQGRDKQLLGDAVPPESLDASIENASSKGYALADGAGATELLDESGKAVVKLRLLSSGLQSYDFDFDRQLVVTADGERIQFWDFESNELRRVDSSAEYVRFETGKPWVVARQRRDVFALHTPLLGQELVDAARTVIRSCLSAEERRLLDLPGASSGDQDPDYCKN